MAYRSCDSVPYARSLRAPPRGKQYSNLLLLHDVWWSSVQYLTSRCCGRDRCTRYRHNRLVQTDHTALGRCAARLPAHAHVVGAEVHVRSGDDLRGTGRALCVTVCVRKIGQRKNWLSGDTASIDSATVMLKKLFDNLRFPRPESSFFMPIWIGCLI